MKKCERMIGETTLGGRGLLEGGQRGVEGRKIDMHKKQL
jgi:hypothetical protein